MYTRSKINLRQVLDDSLPTARRAMKQAMDFYRKPIVVRSKDDASPVTVADETIAETVKGELLDTFGWGAITEETVQDDRLAYLAGTADPSMPVWWIDPIDGTKGFIEQNDEWSILMGLSIDAVAVLGIIAVPATGDLYYGAPGIGAWHELDGVTREIRVNRGSSRGLFKRHPSAEEKVRAVEYLTSRGYQTIQQVGSAIKVGQVAAGDADEAIATDHFYPWDVCASTAVVTAAGGCLVQLANGQPFSFDPTQENIRFSGYSARAWPQDQ